MDSLTLKIIAIIAMTVDHIGYILFPDMEILRIIGRIAMPLFCFLIAYGATKTKRFWRYFFRLLIFAILSQFAINLASGKNLLSAEWMNVLFTLSFGVLATRFAKNVINSLEEKSLDALTKFYKACLWLFSTLALILICCALPIDYNGAGVLLIVLFYIALKHSLPALKITAALSLLSFNILLILSGSFPIQWWSLLALIPILLFKDKKLKITSLGKYFFYIYYPLHLVILYLIAGTLTK